MNAKWTWITGIATISALVLGILFFALTAELTGRDVLVLLIGVVLGGTLTAFIATFLWHKKPVPAATLAPGQFNDAKRADELKRNIDKWEQELVDANQEVEELRSPKLSSLSAMSDTVDGMKRQKAKLDKATLKSSQLRDNIADAKAERENLKVPMPKPIRAVVPKGRIPNRDSSNRR